MAVEYWFPTMSLVEWFPQAGIVLVGTTAIITGVMTLLSFLKITSGRDPARLGFKWVWFGFLLSFGGSIMEATELALILSGQRLQPWYRRGDPSCTTPFFMTTASDFGNAAWCLFRLSTIVLLYAICETAFSTMTLCNTKRAVTQGIVTSVRRVTYGLFIVLIGLILSLAIYGAYTGRLRGYRCIYYPMRDLELIFNVTAFVGHLAAFIFVFAVWRYSIQRQFAGIAPRLLMIAVTIAFIRSIFAIPASIIALNDRSKSDIPYYHKALLLQIIGLGLLCYCTSIGFCLLYAAGSSKKGGIHTPPKYSPDGIEWCQLVENGNQGTYDMRYQGQNQNLLELGGSLRHEVSAGQNSPANAELESGHGFNLAPRPRPGDLKELSNDGARPSELAANVAVPRGEHNAT